MATAHGGNLRDLAKRAGRPVEDILDFSASVNPLGAPDCVRPVISRAIERLVSYPDPRSEGLVEAIARRYQLSADRIVVGNGSTELLFAIARALADRRAIIPVPSYLDYRTACQVAGLTVETPLTDEANRFAVDWARLAEHLTGANMVFLGQPNNPTGLAFDPDAFLRFAREHAATVFVIDEAFAEFVPSLHSLMTDVEPNIIVLRSLTKFYAIPGLRLGFAVATPDTAERIRQQVPNWSVGGLAQAVGQAVLADEDYARRTVDYVAHQRETLANNLAALPGMFVYPGRANYLLARLDHPQLDAHRLADQLLPDGIAIRTFSPAEHLDGRFFRVAVRTEAENTRLVESLNHVLSPLRQPTSLPKQTSRARAIMFQGTSSNAGKSILTAALCRILLQDGVRVAPFKSQNMSLNSFVTRGGGEMGRAQVVQAQACRLEPDVRMNPILLKPNSDTGSQVIVRGQPVGNMRVGQYVAYKPAAFVVAKECYDSLAGQFEAIVLEGAGSPGEVNLKSHDIVNMRMAEYADSPVLIVGDIDRGGVFASFVGTMEVLAEWERKLVAGWIVNRFRGDSSLLGPALDYTLAHTGRPVFGVVPFLRDLALPQEDSVEFKDRASHNRETERANPETARREHHGSLPLASSQCDSPATDTDSVDIAVIDLPHISNFTDFDAFAVEPDVRVRIVRSAAELGRPDAIILPGSKNTLGDLAYLKQSGLADAMAKLRNEGRVQIVGLCGGFQMLGLRIGDPQAIESASGTADALGLLPVETILAADKTLVRTSARHIPSGLQVAGYEIHHGRTSGANVAPLFGRVDGSQADPSDGLLGGASADGAIWGTYLHGVFDADEFRRWFIDRLRTARGLAPIGQVVGCYNIEPALDRLAEVVRHSLDMKAIYRLLKL